MKKILMIASVVLLLLLCSTVTFAEEGGEPTPTTKVKLEWEMTDIDVTCKLNKKWNPDNLCWEDDKTYSATDGGAVFTLTNYSSVKIDAVVAFETESGFTAITTFDEDGNATTVDDGKVTLAADDGDESTPEPTATVVATVKPTVSDFERLEATVGAKYGAYTVTLSRGLVTITFTNKSAESTLTYQGTDYYYEQSFIQCIS